MPGWRTATRLPGNNFFFSDVTVVVRKKVYQDALSVAMDCIGSQVTENDAQRICRGLRLYLRKTTALDMDAIELIRLQARIIASLRAQIDAQDQRKQNPVRSHFIR
jgi:hypothetical protein